MAIALAAGDPLALAAVTMAVTGCRPGEVLALRARDVDDGGSVLHVDGTKTVFFGSGLLFVASLFVTAAVAGSLVVSVRYLGLGPPSATEVDLVRSLSYTLLFAISTRAAAVFLISLGTIGLRSGAFPRWFALTGYLLGGLLMVIVTIWDWVVLVLPAWVAVVSLFILRRERAIRSADRPSDASRPSS